MVRTAQPEDTNDIYGLMQQYAHLGQMLPRDREDIARHISEFVVYEIGRHIVGACSIKVWFGPLAEIRSLAIHPNNQRQGIATRIINHCIEQAEIQPAVEGVFVLTYATKLFQKSGFKIVPKSALPLKIWEDCMGCTKRMICDEIAMYRVLDPKLNEISFPPALVPIRA